MKKIKYKVASLDIETDPFLYGRVPHPFCIGFYDGENYQDFWGDDCIFEMMQYLEQLEEPHKIFVHNGGGFDFWFMQEWITNPIFFINKRVAFCGLMDKHQLRDSYRMIPIALAKFNKDEIDYKLFEENVRERHKKKILHYLYKDCYYLYNMVTQFIEEYGDHLTIGSAAMKHLREMHPNNHEHQYYDALFRDYYMGGRNQCFETGALNGDFKVYDINSSYPNVMRNYSHPFGNQYRVSKKLPSGDMPYFAKIIGDSKGALPILTKSGLTFPHGENEFHACSHEIIAALRAGVLKIKKVIECREFRESQRFDKYVDYFTLKKIQAEEAGDKGGREFAKLLLNTPYGKFGQNPMKYRDCEIFDTLEDCTNAGFTIANEFGDRFIGEKPVELKPWSFNNVAIAASITSAARAELLTALTKTSRPLYCDTDSIICESLDAELHPTKLGAWKNEASLDCIYIGGKKMYSGYKDGECVKRASKGVQLSGDTIKNLVSSGEMISAEIDAPLLRMGQKAKFISRNIRTTY